MTGYKILAVDGDIGKLDDFYFDDQSWSIRYAVVNTGHWLLGRRVLLSPAVLGDADEEEKELSVGLAREQIENSPPVYSDRPVSQQEEIELQRYFGWPAYWGTDAGFAAPAGLWALPAAPLGAAAEKPEPRQREGNPHLRSVREVEGYHIHGSDGEIGHVEDFIVDDEQWVVRYGLVNTRNWWPGKKVIVAISWIGKVDWAERAVSVDLCREEIRNSPEFDLSRPVNREYERKLYEHYRRPGYWS